MNDMSVALHEAGHSFTAWRLGRPVGPVTVRPGLRWAGTSHYGTPRLTDREHERIGVDTPYTLWPPTARHKIDTIALVAAAGYEAEYTLDRPAHSRRIRSAPAEVAAELAAIAAPTPAEERRLALARADTVGLADEERLAALMRLAYPNDFVAGAAWLAHITVQARALVTAGSPAVYRLADALAEHGSLSGRAATRILERS